MDQGLLVVDGEHRVAVCNRRAMELLSLPADLMQGRPPFEDVRRYQARSGEFSNSPPEVTALTGAIGFTHGPSTYERTRPNGTVLEVRTVPTPSGGAVRTFTDITQRKLAEIETKQAAEARRRSEQSLSAALRIARAVSYEWELATDHTIRSDNAGDVLGLASGETMPFFEHLHPEDRAQVENIVQEACAKGTTECTEARYHKPDGQEIWLRIWVQAEFDESGAPVRIFGIDQDITERKQAELALREASTALQATLGNMVEGLIMVDADGILQVCNQRAIQLLDLPPDYQTSKTNFAAFIAHQVALGEFSGVDEASTPWLRLDGNLTLVPPVYERTRPNGTVLEVRTVHLDGGGVVRTYTDVTARKKAERKLHRSEERYRALITASASIVWRAAPGGAILDAVGWEEFTGQPMKSATGSGWLSSVHPDVAVGRRTNAGRRPLRSDFLPRRGSPARDLRCRFAPARRIERR
jgi:PAS domain S-box-containing protein